MNKAFVREPDEDSGRCPRCGSPGSVVHAITLNSHLPGPLRTRLGDSAYFCPSDSCLVVYFDVFERQVLLSELDRGVYPKSPEAPICSCFGFSEDDVRDDIADGQPVKTRALLARASGPDVRCSEAAPSGQSCKDAVQACYYRLRHAT
jgi:hypothetical protein